jgi:hypothetical protein
MIRKRRHEWHSNIATLRRLWTIRIHLQRLYLDKNKTLSSSWTSFLLLCSLTAMEVQKDAQIAIAR